MSCAGCDGHADTGVLCRECLREVAPCDGLIRDHIRSTVPRARAAAWLVDGFGVAHPIAGSATVGRAQACTVTVLATSVSREHAELRLTEAGWHLRDLGSRNGTMVDGLRASGRVALRPPAVIRVGDVAMWFVTSIAGGSGSTASVPTGSAGRGVPRVWFSSGETELCVVGSGVLTSGGSLLARPVGGAWIERSLPPLEYHLLRTLCARARAESDSPATVRGCVTTAQLARDLPFETDLAGAANVRQVVRRLRAWLDELGATDVVAAEPGRGYYLTCAVSAHEPDRA